MRMPSVDIVPWMVSSRPASDGSADAGQRRARRLAASPESCRLGLDGVTVVVAHDSSGSSRFDQSSCRIDARSRGRDRQSPGDRSHRGRASVRCHGGLRASTTCSSAGSATVRAAQVRQVRRGVGRRRRHQPDRADRCAWWCSTSAPITSNLIAVTVGSVPNYLINRAWTFNKRGAHSFTREVLPFWLMALLGLVLSTFAVAWADARYGEQRRSSSALANIGVVRRVVGRPSSSCSNGCCSHRSPRSSSTRADERRAVRSAQACTVAGAEHRSGGRRASERGRRRRHVDDHVAHARRVADAQPVASGRRRRPAAATPAPAAAVEERVDVDAVDRAQHRRRRLAEQGEVAARLRAGRRWRRPGCAPTISASAGPNPPARSWTDDQSAVDHGGPDEVGDARGGRRGRPAGASPGGGRAPRPTRCPTGWSPARPPGPGSCRRRRPMPGGRRTSEWTRPTVPTTGVGSMSMPSDSL